ncbi:hypothetical protein EYF80_067075 [Liparis tanakae]|uniref:Uncharacterized protein n=1 Tax=Liparis tanakae TaxID=230148 RepID=A0A4Z2E2Q8_9TELE|nr:hypothetical protein EYF80_067075 [Liparis tanakae]
MASRPSAEGKRLMSTTSMSTRAHHAHGEPVDHHVGQQHAEAGPRAADGVAQPVDQQRPGEHVDVAPLEPRRAEEHADGRPHRDVHQAQDGEQQRGAARLHAVGRGVRHQVHQRHHEAQHQPRDAHGEGAVAGVVAQLVERHVFGEERRQAAPRASRPPARLPGAALLLLLRPVVHQRLAPAAPGRPQRPHDGAAHAAVEQHAAQHQEAAPPAQRGVQVVAQEGQRAQAQRRARGRHGVGEGAAPHEVVAEDGHRGLEAEAETQTCEEETVRGPSAPRGGGRSGEPADL